LLTPERIKLMKSWEHSGFNVNAAVRIGAGDATGRENLARYLIRAPFSMNKIRNFEIFDPLDFLAAVTSHIPNRGEHNKVFATAPLVCPDCGGAMRIIAFIEDLRVVRAILEHLSLWDEARPPPVTPGAAPHAPAELQYLPLVE
jgi:hypothetical protein